MWFSGSSAAFSVDFWTFTHDGHQRWWYCWKVQANVKLKYVKSCLRFQLRRVMEPDFWLQMQRLGVLKFEQFVITNSSNLHKMWSVVWVSDGLMWSAECIYESSYRLIHTHLRPASLSLSGLKVKRFCRSCLCNRAVFCFELWPLNTQKEKVTVESSEFTPLILNTSIITLHLK